MLRTYKYIIVNQHKLHDFIMAFFKRIEFETGDYSIDFFDKDFYNNIVSHHPKLIEIRLKIIYNEVKTWQQVDRTAFCESIINSNEIEKICTREIVPTDLSQIHSSIRNTVKELFIDLYNKILKGSDYVKKNYGSLLEHFKILKQYPNDFIKCPACGIRDVETRHDDSKDQYDHYLAKSIYPFSSINFKNLVPMCTKCNGLEVKSEKDILKDISGKVFYPFDENHKGIDITVTITKDHLNIDEIEYEITYSNKDGKDEEITSWKYIFNIDSRYKSFIKGRIERWFKIYWSYINDEDIKIYPIDLRNSFYFKSLEKDEMYQLSFLRKPSLETFISNSSYAIATIQSQSYSRYES